MLNRHRSEGQSPERPVYKGIFTTSLSPAEGSDLDKLVRPLSRGRKDILCLFNTDLLAEILNYRHSAENHTARPF